MEIREAIEAIKNNNKLCCDDCEGECGSYKDGKCYCAEATVVSALEEYAAIGTVEECLEAVKKQRAKKTGEPYLNGYGNKKAECMSCHCTVMYPSNYCKFCGQKLDWIDTD